MLLFIMQELCKSRNQFKLRIKEIYIEMYIIYLLNILKMYFFIPQQSHISRNCSNNSLHSR